MEVQSCWGHFLLVSSTLSIYPTTTSSVIKSRLSEHTRECDLYLPLPPTMSQRDELYNIDTLLKDVQHGDMSSSGESSCDYPSTTDSLYAPPSSQTLHCVAQKRRKSQYASLRDIPPLSLDGAGGPTADPGASTSFKTPSCTVSSAHFDPCYSRYEVSEASTQSLSECLPRDSHWVLNRDPPPLIMSSPMDGKPRIRLQQKPTRANIYFTDPSAQKKQRQPMTNLQAQLDEKRLVNTVLNDAAQQVKVALEDSSNAQKRNGSTPPSLQPLVVSGQSAFTQYRSDLEAPPPGKKLAGSIRLPNCYTCMCNETARHLHDIKEENRHGETLERQAEEQLQQRRKQDRQRLRTQEELRRQTQSTWYRPGSPVVRRTPTTTWIEDVRNVCSIPSTTVSSAFTTSLE